MKKYVKKLIPAGFIAKYKLLREASNRKFINLFASSRILASFYYFLFSPQFRREHQAVLQGRLKYYRSLNEIDKSSALLRRNTHRLEKGLIMQPRRSVFAEAYILETVDCFQKAIFASNLCKEEKKWAQDVLQEYFDVVTDTQIIAKARDIFESCSKQISAQNANLSKKSIPQERSSYPETNITSEQLNILFQRRRSVRWYLPKPVPQNKITEAVALASLAPSACNRQPYEFVVINDMQRAPKIAKYAMGTDGFADNLPCIIVVVGKLDAYPAERDRHCIYIDGALAAMQFMLAAETLGLATCPINWPDIEAREKALAKELILSVEQRPIMLIALGYADPKGGVPYSQKKSSSLLIRNA